MPQTLGDGDGATNVRTALNVVFTLDERHAILAGVAIRSLVSAFARSSRCSQFSLHIYIIALDMRSEQQRDLTVCAQSAMVDSRVIFVDHELSQVRKGRDRFVEIITLSYSLPTLLPDIDRVIALDADVMIMGDISELWEIDLGTYWFGSVPCLVSTNAVSLKNYNYSFKVNFSAAAPPINSGVLLIDLKAMRRRNVTGTLQSWTKENSDVTFLTNQEAMALSFPGQWKSLPHEWNFRLLAEPYWTSTWPEFRQYASLSPKIVHFQSGLRPNGLLADLPYFDRWLAHLERTPWASSVKTRRMRFRTFIYCDYFRHVTELNKTLRSLPLKVAATALLMMPVCLLRYVFYLLNPLSFRFRIRNYIAAANPPVGPDPPMRSV